MPIILFAPVKGCTNFESEIATFRFILTKIAKQVIAMFPSLSIQKRGRASYEFILVEGRTGEEPENSKFKLSQPDTSVNRFNYFFGEFDHGSGRTLAACLIHASRALEVRTEELAVERPRGSRQTGRRQTRSKQTGDF